MTDVSTVTLSLPMFASAIVAAMGIFGTVVAFVWRLTTRSDDRYAQLARDVGVGLAELGSKFDKIHLDLVQTLAKQSAVDRLEQRVSRLETDVATLRATVGGRRATDAAE